MSIKDVVQACKAAIERGDDGVVLTLPREAKGHEIRLDASHRRRCPMGTVYQVRTGQTVARFSAIEVLAYLVAMGAVTVESPDATGSP